uniref:Uncharacterized protein n=1 Tax=Soybean thrips nege-like virus 1 TaxID=2802957 RepID=A0A7T8G269_9VIRU|nr:hypothetical protein 2 [Soybean thrips nege-like virus 1]
MSTRALVARPPVRAPLRRPQRFRVVRNVVQRISRPAAKKIQRASNFDIADAFQDVYDTVSSSVSNPLFLLSSLAVFALVITHQTTFTTGVVGKWATDNADNAFAKWLLTNSGKFLGLAIFAPSVLTSPKNKKVLLGVLVFLWVTLIPESSVYQYCLQSAAVHCYFRVKRSSTKMVLVLVIAAAYTFGWLTIAGSQVGSTSGTSAAHHADTHAASGSAAVNTPAKG